MAFARAIAGGALDPTERVVVPARYRVRGTGTAGCADPVEMSVRDLALFMMSMSDNAATPRDVGLLLEAIWTDRAGTPEACVAVRELMSHQVTGHRLAAAFGDDVTVASKTGTLPAVRNDAGVLTYSDGRRYVAAVFPRAHTLADRLPEIDAAIGNCARAAIDELRRDEKPSRPSRP